MPPADAIVLVNPGDKVVEVHYGPDSYRVRPKEQVRVHAVVERSRAHIDELVRIGLLHEVGARVAPPAAATSPATKRAAPAKKSAAPAKKWAAPAKRATPAKERAAPAKKSAAPAKTSPARKQATGPTRSTRSTRKRPGGS